MGDEILVCSHGLRFELKRPLESADDFIRRINNEVEYDEGGGRVPTSADDAKWFIGPQPRDRGSLISDLWIGTAASLAACDQIAVRAVGGWWRYNKRTDRVNAPIRYALVMSLETTPEHVDFYSAIEVALDMPVMTTIVVYDAPTGLLVPWVAAAADDVDQLHHP
jgi:hypothetical protein